MRREKIIVRGPNWVGDAVLAVPALKAIRQRRPEADITLLVRPWVRGLFQIASPLDALMTQSSAGALGWMTTARELRQAEFDLAILLTNSFESALTVFTGGVRERTGYATDHRSFLLTHPVKVPSHKLHQTLYYLNLIDACVGPGLQPDIDIRITSEALASARTFLGRYGITATDRLLILSPGAAFGSAKRWKPDRFAALGDLLSRDLNARAAIVGSQSEKILASQISSLMKEPVAILAGATDLEMLVGVLASATLVVSNDSGPMHIAAALGTPTVGIFGSTDADVTGPVGTRTRIVRNRVDCSPCLLRECPIDHRCMEGLSIDDVLEAGRSLAGGFLSETSR